MRIAACRSSIAFVAVVGVLMLLGAAHANTASKVSGTWRLDKSKGMLPGGQATFDSTLIVDIAGDVVTTKRTGIFPADAALNTYEVDGQLHSYPFGDTFPQLLRARTAKWLQDADGFEVIEGGTTARWTASSDGQFLTIETTISRPCPPCSPANPRVDHTIYVFVRQP